MAKLSLHVAIIFLSIAECIGPKGTPKIWTDSINKKLLDIFYGIDPTDGEIWDKVKREWDREIPVLKGIELKTLKRHITELRNQLKSVWLGRPWTEREQMDDTLARIYEQTKGDRHHHELRMLHVLFHHFPQYKQEPEIIRNVVYRWYERYAPLGKEILAADVDWTPGRKAHLRYLIEQFSSGHSEKNGDIIRDRWLKKYNYLNVKRECFMPFVRKLRKEGVTDSEEQDRREAEQEHASQSAKIASARRGKKVDWDKQMNADLFYIGSMIRNADVRLVSAIKERWDRMQETNTHFNEKMLSNHIYYLQTQNYKPDPESFQRAKEKYERLPPIPKEVFTKCKGRRRTKNIVIPESHVTSLQHQNEPDSPSIWLTPELLAHLPEDMAEVNATYAGHAHYPHESGYHGSSSHTPFDQGHFASLQDTPHPQHRQWFPGESSNHTSIHDDPFSSLPDIVHDNPDFWNLDDSSNHTPFHQGHFASLPHIPQQHENPWNPAGSSSHTPIYQAQFDSLLNYPHGHQEFSSIDGSSSHTSIHEDPSSLIPVTSRSRHRQQDHGPSSSSSHTSFQEYPSTYLAVTPRPPRRRPDHRGSSNHTSVYHADTPRPYRHQ